MVNREKELKEWLARETEHKRKALENASRHFDDSDVLDAHTLEAIYSRESNFGHQMGENGRGSDGPAGHFQFDKLTAKDYGLEVTKENDERFDIDLASDAAARYLKKIDGWFSRQTELAGGARITSPIEDKNERKKFVLAAYNAGPGRIALTQMKTKEAGQNPTIWKIAFSFLSAANAEADKIKELTDYIPDILSFESWFSVHSEANKDKKDRKPKKQRDCAQGHWVTIDDRPVYICDEWTD
jgi:membrane-bound lytic murein transglycosylase MltF